MDTVTVEYTQDDVNEIVALIDAGVKALGLQGAKAAARQLEKLESAVAAARSTETEEGHA